MRVFINPEAQAPIPIPNTWKVGVCHPGFSQAHFQEVPFARIQGHLQDLFDGRVQRSGSLGVWR